MAEQLGTMLLILFGDGVAVNALLSKSERQNSSWIVVTAAWGWATRWPSAAWRALLSLFWRPDEQKLIRDSSGIHFVHLNSTPVKHKSVLLLPRACGHAKYFFLLSARATAILSAVVVLSGWLALPPVAEGASYTVQQINSPGPALRMSSSGAVAGNYVARCVTLSSRPKRTICYWAPWVFDGKRVAKLAGVWPNDVDVRCSAVNNSLDIVGRDSQAYLGGGWILSGGGLTHSGWLPGGSWSSLVAINNLGLAVGVANTSSTAMRAVVFSNGTISEVVFNDSTLSSATTGTSAIDVNDAGMVAGSYSAADGDHGFVVDQNGTVTLVPNLLNATGCRPLRLSQVNPVNGQVWLAGHCGGRPFLFEVTTRTLRELGNLPGGSNLSVQSVNSYGVAVGTAVRPGASAPDGYTALIWPAASSLPVDLNANYGFAPATAWNVHSTDINDMNGASGATVLTGYNDTVGNFFTFQLHLLP